jgi:hypothetical protein
VTSFDVNFTDICVALETPENVNYHPSQTSADLDFDFVNLWAAFSHH